MSLAIVVAVLLAAAGFAACALFVGLWMRERGIASELRSRVASQESELARYDAIVSIEQEVARLTSEHRTQQATAGERQRAVEAELARVTYALQETTRTLDVRRHEIAVLEEMDGLHEVAFYRTRYGLPTSDAYEAKLDTLRARQKAVIQGDIATACDKEWLVDGNKAKGKKMTDQQRRLMLRAFNGECDASIARVSYKNVETMHQRIEKAAEAINKLGASNSCRIVPDYVALKLEELFLMHEYELRLEAEKEEQRRIRAEMQEEQREQKELERSLREAEKEEARYEKALKDARKDLEKASSEERAKLETKIAELQQRLIDTQRKKSQAELTKRGHVYVLSNVGSFGDGVYKIGMTRRLDPMERVWELSDASVPFDFDVHALIHTTDAPALEHTLHKYFDEHRLNKVNLKREFFAVTLDEIRQAVEKHHRTTTITFTLAAEAAEYRKSHAIKQERLARLAPQASG